MRLPEACVFMCVCLHDSVYHMLKMFLPYRITASFSSSTSFNIIHGTLYWSNAILHNIWGINQLLYVNVYIVIVYDAYVLYIHVTAYHMYTQQVLECCWADLLQDIESAPDLDHLITTHSSFLRLITTRCLLDPKSQVIYHWHWNSGVARLKAMRGQTCSHEILKLFMITWKANNPMMG